MGGQTKPFELRRILAIKLRALGDSVILTSGLASLKRALPEAEIHALVPKAWAPVLDHNPDLARVWAWAPGSGALAKWGATLSLARELRAQNFDAVVNFHASGTSSWIARLSGASVRSVHFHGHQQTNRFSTVVVPGKGELKPIIERDLDALRALDLPTPLLPAPTRVVISELERAQARARLQERGLSGPLLALGLGASRPTKVWPMQRFAELAQAWRRETEGSVLALAAPNEEHLVQAFLSALSPKDSHIQIETKLPLRMLAATLMEARIFTGNDSGPKHLAVAVDTPTVTVFGPEHPFEWHPYDRMRHPLHFIDGVNCRTNLSPNGTRWCGIHECIVEQHRCLRDIGASEVLASCLKLLLSKV